MHSTYEGAGHESGPTNATQPHRLLAAAAEAAALVGGCFLLAMVATTIYSIVGREVANAPLLGNVEIVELFTGVAVFSFFPYTHLKRANVTATFFTDRAPWAARAVMDLAADAAYLALSVILTWRIGVGLEEAWHGTETSMVLGLPEWLYYAPALLWSALLVAVAVGVVLTDLRGLAR